MIIERPEPPTDQPFTSEELFTHVRVDDAEMQAEAVKHGWAAATELMQYASIALIAEPIRVTLEAWPRSCWFPLPIAPVLDPMSATVTVDGEAFEAFSVVTGLRPALRLSGDRPCGLIVIEYEAGFGDAATDIPMDLQLAILDQASATFDGRGPGDSKTNGMSPHMARIAARYRRVAL